MEIKKVALRVLEPRDCFKYHGRIWYVCYYDFFILSTDNTYNENIKCQCFKTHKIKYFNCHKIVKAIQKAVNEDYYNKWRDK